MMTLIIGKSKSGKSMYAEELLEKMTGISERYYIATMEICDEVSKERAGRHKKQRAGRGFITIEQTRDVGKVIEQMVPGSAALLECMTNLVANELFEGISHDISKKILQEIEALSANLRHLLIVSGDTSEYDEHDVYDEETKLYIKLLRKVNEALAERADEVIVIEDGLPVTRKVVNEAD